MFRTELGDFYEGLAAAEARHFALYLNLAEKRGGDAVTSRIEEFTEIEAQLVNHPDRDFRFHSGVPVNAE